MKRRAYIVKRKGASSLVKEPLGEEDSVAVQVLPSTLAFMKAKLEGSVARVPTAHGRLGNAQTAGRAADVQFFRYGHEIPQVAQLHRLGCITYMHKR